MSQPVMEQTLLLVVGIAEGRNFPSRHGYQLILETRFQGEVLQSDPVDHVSQPLVNTELAWSLNKKSLHQHRLQRTPIKLQLYAVSGSHGDRTSIGYIMLDLRMATPKGHSQWYGLLNCQYPQQRPQLYVTMTTEQDHVNSQDTVVTAGKELPGATTMTLELDEEQGYYTLGHVTMDTSVYVLSVTITSASRLSQLSDGYHSDLISEDKQPAYYFYYSLLGNDITNGAFYSLACPSFRPERASIRIKSDRPTLNTFIAGLADLKVHLYAGKILLAVAKIPVNPLSTVTTVTAEYPLETQQKYVAMETCPVVAVTLVLDTDFSNQVIVANQNQEQSPLMSPLATALDKHDTSSSSSSVGTGHSNSIGSHDNSVQYARRSLVEQFSQVTMETGNQSLDESSDHLTTPPPTSSNQIQVSSGAPISSTSIFLTNQIPPSVTTNQIPSITTNQNSSSAITANQIPVTANQILSSITTNHIPSFDSTNQDAHHYCVAIDIRSLRLLLDHVNNSMISGRYWYQFFGTPQPVLLPPINATPFVECPFERSLCAFDFGTTREVLLTQLSNVPLIVELVQNAAVMGGAEVMMSSVLNQPIEMVGAEGSVSRQCVDMRSGVTSSHDNKLIGELHIVISLEDHGHIQSHDPLVASHDPIIKSHNPTVPQPVLRDDPEYRVAMELEVWRAEQEDLFIKQLQQREADHMRLLAEEWRQREKQRDHVIQTKVASYHKLQEQLQQSLDHVIQQRQHLEAWQQELQKLEKSLQEERRNLTSQLEDVSNKLEQEYEHKMRMEQLHSQELQSQVTKLTNQLSDAERLLANRTAELQTHLQTTGIMTVGGGDAKLQAQVNTLLLEKSQLEHKLSSANKSRHHYKEQWSHALRELAHMRQQEASASRQRLRQQEQELDHMRQQLLSHSHQQLLRDDVEQLKSETERLQQNVVTKATSSSPGQRPLITQTTTGDDIARWIEERDILLQTGLYSSDDATITRLDHQIRTAMAVKHNHPVT